MPLQRKCDSCGRMLVVEDVFQGAHCRCKFCRSLVEIPRSQTLAKKSVTRPDAPARSATVSSAAQAGYVEALPGRRVAPPVAARPPLGKRITLFRVGATVSLLGAALLGVVVWTATGGGDDRPIDSFAYTFEDDDDLVSEAVPKASENPRLAILRSDPLRSYFGVPIEGKTVGYVIDGDGTMAPYLDQIAFITNSVNTSFDIGTIRFGIVQAVENPDGARLYEVFEPSTDLAGATTLLHGRLASGVTDLARAFAVTESWYADSLFLVLSKRLPYAEIDYLAQLAEQTGAVTHVIAFGQAAEDDDLSLISDVTNGQFVRVKDDLLTTLVQKHEAAALGEE